MNTRNLSMAVGGFLVLLLAVLLGKSMHQQATLQSRLHAESVKRAHLEEELRAAEGRALGLAAERRGDRDLIAQLWSLVRAEASRPDRNGVEPRPGTNDLAALKIMAQASGGDLSQVVRQVLTPQGLNASLERHADEPGFWVAAASLCGDPSQAMQYLETAAARFPGSAIAQASLIEAKRDLTHADPATRTAIENLRKADPTSSLADHYDAYFRFQEGDTTGALQALTTASEKDRFADNRMELMMDRYQCLLENGCSDGGALALSAFSLGFEHLPMLRQVSWKALEQAQGVYSSGDEELALSTADSVARIGRNLSASGRFIVYDRVGLELQEAALQAKRRFYEGAGATFQVRETDSQLEALRRRSVQIREMAGAFGGILANMTDEGIVRYIEATIMHGEFATLQNLTARP